LKYRTEQARERARELLKECYEQELLRGSMGERAAPGSMADKDVREAILAILRCQFNNTAYDPKDLSILKASLSEPVESMEQYPFGKRHLLFPGVTDNRNVSEMLIDYLQLWVWKGCARLKPPLFVCRQCNKVAVKTRHDERFCSRKCRTDFWNSEKMRDYYREKKRQSRERQRLRSQRPPRF